jgi:3-hydroxyacyl-CoA dehydrogenase/enoyl-CoA hydratase/3-hydroxybutyryl-CoA epimerase/enoyl-CoA isomerase
MSEARALLQKQVRAQRLDAPRAEAVLAAISPQLDDTGLAQADVIVEAVVENLEIKHRVLTQLEGRVRNDAIIASNTSSLRIDDLAAPLARAENFIGMHFFNPVPVMPLVEVIRGSRTSESAVATVVGYSVTLGKTPILVQDGPGFLVNRILTPYMLASSRLIADGADFARIDQVMEEFGWPRGPNYLNDVIGMDTAAHVFQIICAGLAPRLRLDWVDSVGLMVAQQRFGQKNGIGFYRYEAGAQGRPQRRAAPDSYAVLAAAQPDGTREFAAQEIIERLMLPLIIEAAHALEAGVVASAGELDMALLLGLGFPRYLGGALKYADWLGLDRLVRSCERYTALGPLYEPTAAMRHMASAGERYYPR